jgi:leader peptidase (prepilin peptidase)/N-methyltransferase
VEANIPLVACIHAGLESLIGALIGAGLVYWVAALAERLFGRPAMGEGDVKFVGFIGAFCGWQGAVFAFFGGALFGTILLLPWLLFLKCQAPKVSTESEQAPAVAGLQVPFGPFLALAGLAYFLGLNQAVDLYFQQVALNFGL